MLSYKVSGEFMDESPRLVVTCFLDNGEQYHAGSFSLLDENGIALSSQDVAKKAKELASAAESDRVEKLERAAAKQANELKIAAIMQEFDGKVFDFNQVISPTKGDAGQQPVI